MSRHLIILVHLVIATLAATTAIGDERHNENRPLADAVAEFNEKAKSKQVGQYQPPLTEDEVVAALLSIDRKLWRSMDDKIYEVIEEIARKRELPKTARLDSLSRFKTNGYDFVTWQVILEVILDEDTGYRYPIRKRMISSSPEQPGGDRLRLLNPLPST